MEKVAKTGGKRPKYIKPQSIRDFEERYSEWEYRGRSIPEHCRVVTKFRDDTAPHLEKLIIAYGRMMGWCLSKISTTGVYRDGSKVVTDCLGNRRVIGSGKWTKGGATLGVADVTGVIGGRYVEIEVKIGRDRQREDQRAHQLQVEAAGGKYIIVKSFDDFLSKINGIL